MRSDPLSLTELKQIDSLSSEFESEIRKTNDLSLTPWTNRIAPNLRETLVREIFAMTCEILRGQGVADPVQRMIKANPTHRTLLLSLNEESTLREAGTSSHVLATLCPGCQAEIRFLTDSSTEGIACLECNHEFSIANDQRSIEATIRVGQYQLLNRVGLGGFGTVWKAHDTELKRTVALKIPRKSNLDESQIASIQHEAQAVARLDHPNIVTIFTVESDHGTPIIVEEFIDGMSLKQWASKCKPDLRQIASVIAEISDALQCAHDAGVIHRDLKPSNIMIDDVGRSVIVDFGLAKDILNQEQEATHQPEVMGTFAYMAPEQAAGNPQVDQRCDLFSLGVVLYELTTGTRPFGGSIDAFREQVASRDPTAPREYNFRISRDLNTIILRCLQKNPAKRYQSARELSEELERYLNGQPIHARPVSLAERTLRLAVRNPTVSLLGTALIATLITGTCVSVFFALNADHNRRLADTRAEVAEDAVTTAETIATTMISAFRSPEPGINGYDVTVAEMLSQAEERVPQQLRDHPQSLASVLKALGQTRLGMGMYQEAYEDFVQAGALFESTHGPNAEETLDNQFLIADTLTKLNRMPEAIELHREVLDGRIAMLGEMHQDTLNSQMCLASALVANGDLEKGVELQERMLAVSEAAETRDDFNVFALRNNLAVAYRKQERFEEAFELQERACKLVDTISKSHPDRLIASRNLVTDHVRLGHLEEAVRIGVAALERHQLQYAKDHPDFKSTALLVLSLCSRLERNDLAAKVIRDFLQLDARSNQSTILSESDLADFYYKSRRFDEAVPHFRNSLSHRKQLYGETDQRVISLLRPLAVSLVLTSRYSEAIPHFEQLVNYIEGKEQDSSLFPNVWIGLGYCHSRLGSLAESRRYYGKAAEKFEWTARTGRRGPEALCDALTASAGAGRTEDVQRLGQLLLEQVGGTRDPSSASKLAHSMVPYPDLPDEINTQVLRLAKIASRDYLHPERLIAAARYRLDDFEQAKAGFIESEERGHLPRIWDLAFRSMANAQLGNLTQAREHLRKARTMPLDRLYWIERVESLALLSEASALLEQKTQNAGVATR